MLHNTELEAFRSKAFKNGVINRHEVSSEAHAVAVHWANGLVSEDLRVVELSAMLILAMFQRRFGHLPNVATEMRKIPSSLLPMVSEPTCSSEKPCDKT